MFPLLSHIYLATHVRTRDYSGYAHDNEEDTSHHCAHEETVDAVSGDDAGDDDEGAGRAADLRLRSAEGGDQEARDNGALDAGLRRESRGNGKGHGQWEGDEADGDSGDHVEQKFVAIVIAQTE